MTTGSTANHAEKKIIIMIVIIIIIIILIIIIIKIIIIKYGHWNRTSTASAYL